MGSVFKRHGKWYIRFTDGNGDRRGRAVGSKRAAMEALVNEERVKEGEASREVLMQALDRTKVFVDWRISGLLKKWLKAGSLKGRREKTLSNSKGLVNKFLSIMGRGFKVNQLSAQVMDRFIEHRKAEGISPRRINHGIAALKAMCNWAVGRDLLLCNPVQHYEKLPATPVFERRALEDHEIEALMAHSKPPHTHMDLTPIWTTLLYTGIRKNQLVELRWGDWDRRKAKIHLSAKYAKTHRDVWFPLDP